MKKSKGGLLIPENQLLENIKEANELNEASKIYLEAMEAKQKEIEEKLSTLEMLPLGHHIVVLPYPENPYSRKIQNGILLDSAGIFDNPDSGSKEKMKEGIVCAKVIEVGPETKYVNVGDDIYYPNHTASPIPFFRMGYKLVSEFSVITVIGSNLTERFKEVVKSLKAK